MKISTSIMSTIVMSLGICGEAFAQPKPYQPPPPPPSLPQTHVHTYGDPTSSTGVRTEIHRGPLIDVHRTPGDLFKEGAGKT